jgi:hypothetical protein
MVINNLDALCGPVSPDKANPPLIVDPDTVLPAAAPFQSFKAIAGRRS